jgi:hypothetical protein
VDVVRGQATHTGKGMSAIGSQYQRTDEDMADQEHSVCV